MALQSGETLPKKDREATFSLQGQLKFNILS